MAIVWSELGVNVLLLVLRIYEGMYARSIISVAVFESQFKHVLAQLNESSGNYYLVIVEPILVDVLVANFVAINQIVSN